VTAQLSAASGLNVTVPYVLTGTASDPADYTVTASPITINAGSTTASVTITVVDDALDETNETVIVTMGSPTNATQGATTFTPQPLQIMMQHQPLNGRPQVFTNEC
jgi:hypothetical protein